MTAPVRTLVARCAFTGVGCLPVGAFEAVVA